MESFTTITENDIVPIDAEEEDNVDDTVLKQMNQLKNKVDQLKNEAKQNEASKTQLSTELKHLKNNLDDNIDEQKKTSLKQEVIEAADDLKNKKLDKQEIETIKNLTDADKLLRDENILLKTSL